MVGGCLGWQVHKQNSRICVTCTGQVGELPACRYDGSSPHGSSTDLGHLSFLPAAIQQTQKGF